MLLKNSLLGIEIPEKKKSSLVRDLKYFTVEVSMGSSIFNLLQCLELLLLSL